MRLPIVSGIYADSTAELRTSYPRNLFPVPKMTGVSEGHLRTARGVRQYGTSGGPCRGGAEWKGDLYRVQGANLYQIYEDGTQRLVGEITGTDTATMVRSFDYLGIAADGKLWLYDGTVLRRVVDPDLGDALSVTWQGGYFITTDGENIVVTELSNPFSVNPLKYASSEVDPDPVVCVLRQSNEVYAINQYTIEVFSNIGGSNFPFQVVSGAQINKGAVGTHAAIEFDGAIMFVGGGRNESPAIWAGVGGAPTKISTSEIDRRLLEYTESELASIVLEKWTDRNHNTLLIHLPDCTLCYDQAATAVIGQPAWYTLHSDFRHLVWHGNRWTVGRAADGAIGYVDDTIGTIWGEALDWEIITPIVYAEGNGGIFHEVELVGRLKRHPEQSVSLEYSADGEEWSPKQTITAGSAMKWVRQGYMRDARLFRFTGTTAQPTSFSRVDALVEGLAW